MAQIKTHELAYSIEAMLTRRLRDRRVTKPGELAAELTEKIIDFIPSEAFEPQLPWSDGRLFFHGDVDEERIHDMQLQMTEAHLNISQAKPITLYLSSFGGGCHAGLALCGTIQELRRQGRIVNCHIQGYAMSMGTIIAQACDHRSIDDDAWMMLHEIAWDPEYSKTSYHEDSLESHRRLQNQLYGFYARRTGKSADFYTKKLHKFDWFLTPSECLTEKLVDAVCAAPAFKTYRRTK